MIEFVSEIRAAQGPCLFSVGQAGFIMKNSSNHLLAIDLYLSNCVERMEGHSGFKRLLPQILDPSELFFDVVICTHPHMDHFDVDSIPEILSKGSKLFCSRCCDELVQQAKLDYYNDQITFVSPGSHHFINDYDIEFTHCDHGIDASDAVGVLCDCDGKTVY